MRRIALIAARPTPTGDALAAVSIPGLRVEQLTPERLGLACVRHMMSLEG